MDPQIRRIQPLRSEGSSALRRRPGAERSEAFRLEPAAARDGRQGDAGQRDAGDEDDEPRQVAPRADDEAGSHLDVTA